MKNLLIVDNIEKKQLVENSSYGDQFTYLTQSDIVYNSNVLNESEFKELFFYFDESVKNKSFTQETVRILEVKQYYILNPNSDSDIDEIVPNSKQILYGDIKADALRKNIDVIYQSRISQVVRQVLFKQKVIDAVAIKKLEFNRASPVVLGLIAEAEQKILDFKKDEFIRVSVDYAYKDDNDIDEETQLAKMKSFKLQCRTKFTKEYKDELELTLNTLKNQSIPHKIKDIKRKTEELAPYPPLTTTRLQRNCFYLFDIDPSRTIAICEDLCNGIKINGVKTKFITSPFSEGRNIDDDSISKINKLLLESFGAEYVMSSKRVFAKGEDETEQEAIRPLHINNEYYPDNELEKLMPILHFEIYKFIFQRTLATQMKNSIYDASKIVVSVNDIELIANAHKREFDGWERLDGYRQQASDNDDDVREKELTLPENLLVGQELKRGSVSDFVSEDKNPPRYGKGRLLTTIVESGLCKAQEAHLILSSMEKVGLVKVVSHMVHPLEIGMKCDELFRESAPFFRDTEALKEYEIKVHQVKDNSISPDDVQVEYDAIANELEVATAYESNISEPEEWMIEKAKKVAKFHGDILTDDNPMFRSRQMILSYLNTKENDLEKLGRCPECKKEQVVEDDFAFRCVDKSCKFKLYKSGKDGKSGGMKGFFNNFKKELSEDSYKDLVMVLIKTNGKIHFDNLVKKKSGTFSAYVVLKKDRDYNSWQLSLKFPKPKTEIKDSIKAENVFRGVVKPNKTKDERKPPEKKIDSPHTTQSPTPIVEPVIKKIEIKEVRNKLLLESSMLISHKEKFRASNVDTTEIKIVFENYGELCFALGEEITDTMKFVVIERLNKILMDSNFRFKLYEDTEDSIKLLLVKNYSLSDIENLKLELISENDELTFIFLFNNDKCQQ